MSLSRYSFLTIRSCGLRFGAARLSTFSLPASSSAASPGTLRRHTSTMPPPDPVGQSGRHYLIEQVIQEKGIPPRRVYLATYVFLKLNCPMLSNLLTSANTALKTKSLY